MIFLYNNRILLAGTIVIASICCGMISNLRAQDKQVPITELQVLAANVPDHDIKYEDELSPDWKVNWDLARKLYRENKFREALIQYELLFAQKENIDEARWEYTSILLHFEHWQKAEHELQRLISSEPSNKKYLFALARVYLKSGKVSHAVKLYDQLYSEASEGPETVRALEGLTAAVELQQDYNVLLPLIEQLIVLKPDDISLSKKLVNIAMDHGKFDKAEKTLQALEQQGSENVFVLQKKAELYELKGNMDEAAVYWQKLIAVNPENTDVHTKLHHYYTGKSNWQMSLKHVEQLLKNQPNDVVLLETAAELNLKTGRVDKALEYYDYLLAVTPGNETILKKKKNAMQALAADLLILVENEGSEKLWQDLVNVTSDRPGVYKEIATLLRKKQKTDELIEVLALIYQEDPGDKKTLAELKYLLNKNGRSQELTSLLNENDSAVEAN